MTTQSLALPALVAGLLALLLANPAVAAGKRPARAALQPVAGEVIVQFKAEAASTRRYALALGAQPAAVRGALEQRAGALGARVGRTLLAGNAVGARTQVVRAAGVDAATLARELAADPEVAYAVPNGRRRILTAPNDPLYARGPALDPAGQTGGPEAGQWYLRAPDATLKSAIDIEAAWAHTTGSASVVVAVLDTGVRFEHPDLGRVAAGGKLLPGYDFVSDAQVGNDGDGRDADPSDPGDWVTRTDATNNATFFGCGTSNSSWHGTSTASLVGAKANDGAGMAGSAPGARVLPVRVLGKCFGTDADIQAGMLWAAGIHVDGVPDNPDPAQVLNLSLGGEGSCDAAYRDVVDQILARGAVIVAAAGNTAGGPVGTPANCPGVISVLALRHVGTKVGFSDLGPEIVIAAPGGNCVNTAAGTPCLYPILAASDTGTQAPVASKWTDSYDSTVGTSFASPLVAGVAALMFSQQPTLTPAQLKTALQAGARPFPTTGGDNGPDDPTLVTQCHAPVSGVEQLQCYCTTALCGAGMLDAGAAVAAVSGPLARIDVTTTTPTAGSVVALSGSASTVASGHSVATWAWALVDGGGIVTGFGSATNAATASLTPSAAGSFTVRLTITDDLGRSNLVTRAVTVAAAPVVTPPPADTGGGGAASIDWVLGVLLAALVLRRGARRSHLHR